ncbi:MAG: 16S rRNA (guanine(527)-N(7))-methyltransferase RsmG [Prevotellaceae bacterium]|jgi:16S rRNA (guanine527-N7)-methyltransferase|nr:16S rRNA (guanine(527)-N(7))-methyltransferase RsmG [Bacteroidaceae bacterium]MCI6802042.1 16S rRNA (guanine(527)-N(7))-methyltransferase RsmG [Prevotellaceae bacterium]MDD6016379.1 16S rRNA (guanine(527)-N(7))-methyltransferase RsmG [Prevotellaceae bacterium]MDY6257442.1 16S rRNA (guanine(527)-N(7))-methyltransferase RsmG [Bacteroidaceae bacterium]
MTIIQKYFTNLTGLQVEQFAQLEALYNDWNAKINVISRKDIQNLYEHHVLHSLGIAKVVNFRDETTVMDLGTGGGFPGIPLAILFPHVQFHLVDSVGKKVKVANEVATAIGLKNVKFSHARAEEIKEQYDFVVTRAVMPMVDLVKVARKNIKKEQHNAVPNGIIALKGGELNGEIASMKNIATVWELSDFFDEEYFKTKKVVHVTIVNRK